MAAHGREDKGLAACFLNKIYNCLDNQGNIGNASASAGDCNGVALVNTLRHAALQQLLANLSQNLLPGNIGMIQLLTNLDHPRQRNRIRQSSDHVSFLHSFQSHMYSPLSYLTAVRRP